MFWSELGVVYGEVCCTFAHRSEAAETAASELSTCPRILSMDAHRRYESRPTTLIRQTTAPPIVCTAIL